MEMDETTMLLILELSSAHLNLVSAALELMDIPKKKRRRRWWVKPMLLNRIKEGTVNILLSKSINDGFNFEEFLRMDKDTFNYLLSEIEHDISCETTHLRQPVQPCEKLAVTLRYLATGLFIESHSLVRSIYYKIFTDVLLYSFN